MTYGKHTRNAGWQPNNHWVECERCGFDYRVSDVKTEWNGAVVCKYCFETRHPQDFVRGVKDDTSPVGPTRPTLPQESACSQTCAVAGKAIAGCAIAGLGIDFCKPDSTFTT